MKNFPIFFALIFIAACNHKKPPHFTCIKQTYGHTPEKPFVIIIPSYNNQEWYSHNLNSIYQQKYTNFRVIYIDDCSTDNTAAYVEKYAQKNKLKNFIFIKNERRLGSLANIWHAINQCAPHEIVITLDGDDWLAHDQALATINHYYHNPHTWITYGQFQNWPTGTRGWCKKVPADVITNNTFREFGFWFAQPRTFYAWLAQKINVHDLYDPATNNFFRVAGDVAFMFPLMELAGTHSVFIDEILYLRNVKTPINDFKINLEQQLQTTECLRTQSKYTPHHLQKTQHSLR